MSHCKLLLCFVCYAIRINALSYNVDYVFRNGTRMNQTSSHTYGNSVVLIETLILSLFRCFCFKKVIKMHFHNGSDACKLSSRSPLSTWLAELQVIFLTLCLFSSLLLNIRL